MEAVTELSPLAREGAVVLGAASGLARRFVLDPVAVRLAFVGAAAASPPLALLYIVAVPFTRRRRPPLPRLAGADPRSSTSLVAPLTIEAGLVLFARAVGLALPDVALLVIGVVQAVATFRLARGFGGDRGIVRFLQRAVLVRLAAGVALSVAGLWLLTDVYNLRAATQLLAPIVLIALGGGLIALPPLLRVSEQIADERRDRIRADERARLATHLHDSVLQTLTLIQRRADDAEVASLARRQERELREWLYGGVAAEDAGRLRDRLAALAAEIEDRYRWRIELIVVGDRDVAGPEEALLAATREALVNAARHSGASHCDLYAECDDEHVTLFVRDRGRGFAAAEVSDDRRGIADSIAGRLAAVGGSARIRTAPGEGCEVALDLPIAAAAA